MGTLIVPIVMEPNFMADLSVIVVNYNSGWFCANLIESLLDQEFTTSSGDPGKLEIIVVDNASPNDQRSMLDPLNARDEVKVVYSDTNSGYSGGNNLGVKYATSDWVMITNPDVVFMKGAIQELLNVLYNDSSIGQVGPRAWLDPDFHFLLPPVEPLTTFGHLYESAGRIFKSIGKRYSMSRAAVAKNYWSGDGTVEADIISGFCFVMPMDLARKLGPFDEKFPFYYEDNDLLSGYVMRGKSW